MSASQTEIFDNDVVMSGAPVPRAVERGQIDPRAVHYGYSAGEHELKTRAGSTGYASILPGLLVPLRLFKRNVPNDTIAALDEEKAPQNLSVEVTPRDSADALMSRYQHRGFRMFMALVGMPETEAVKLFRIVHPSMPCKARPKDSKQFKQLNGFDQRILSRHCVACRLDDMRNEISLERIEKAKLSQDQTIEYGRTDDGGVRVVSPQETAIFMHEQILSGLEEHHQHMMDTLQQSKADVEAGRTGPGKKKYDQRDNWYFIMTHKSPNEIEATMETMMRAQGSSLASELGRAIKEGLGDRSSDGISLKDVEKLIAQREAAQEKKHKEELAQLRKEMAAKSKDKPAKEPKEPTPGE